MYRPEFERRLHSLAEQAWEAEVRWPEIEAWASNFTGQTNPITEEQAYALFALTRFTYFGRRLTREMLRSLYRDHFQAPIMQRIRRNLGGKKDIKRIEELYRRELRATRFISVGNPSESGAHLLYYFRQVNHLSKNLFSDFAEAFSTTVLKDRGKTSVSLLPRDRSVSRVVFFDDLIGSGTQVSRYLGDHLPKIRAGTTGIDLRFMSLFATTEGLTRLNSSSLFDGKASTLFELDDTYKVFDVNSRSLASPPEGFEKSKLELLATHYGAALRPSTPLGYKNGQLLIGFSHNTPNNTLPIFWDEGNKVAWNPIFIRFDKKY